MPLCFRPHLIKILSFKAHHKKTCTRGGASPILVRALRGLGLSLDSKASFTTFLTEYSLDGSPVQMLSSFSSRYTGASLNNNFNFEYSFCSKVLKSLLKVTDHACGLRGAARVYSSTQCPLGGLGVLRQKNKNKIKPKHLPLLFLS